MHQEGQEQSRSKRLVVNMLLQTRSDHALEPHLLPKGRKGPHQVIMQAHQDAPQGFLAVMLATILEFCALWQLVQLLHERCRVNPAARGLPEHLKPAYSPFQHIHPMHSLLRTKKASFEGCNSLLPRQLHHKNCIGQYIPAW